MMLKLEDNASGYFKRNIGVKNCFEDNEEKGSPKKDKGTETLEDFALLTEEIKKRKTAEKKVLESQMMMDDDEKIDTAMEIKVLRDACEEEAKLRRSLEADGLKTKLQIEQLKMKLKVFDAEKADFKANMLKAGACIAHEHESANNMQALLAEEIKRRNKLEIRVRELEMLLGAKDKKSNDEEAINVFKRVTEDDSMQTCFEDELAQNGLGHEENLTQTEMFHEETPSKMVKMQNQEEFTGLNGDNTNTKRQNLRPKEDEKTSSSEVFLARLSEGKQLATRACGGNRKARESRARSFRTKDSV